MHNFNVIRKAAQQATAQERNYYANAIGLGEKSLRVLRLTDEEWQNIYETQAKEAPLLNKEQKGKAESYTRMETRAGIAKDATIRRAAIATAPTLEKGAEKILDGAKFIDATFSNSKKNEDEQSKAGKFYDMFANPKLSNFAGGPIKKGIEGILGFFEESRKVIQGETSFRKDAKGLMPETARNREIERQIPKNWDGQKTIIINQNFQNKTDIQVQNAKDLQEDFVKHAGDLVHDTLMGACKDAAENCKSGALN